MFLCYRQKTQAEINKEFDDRARFIAGTAERANQTDPQKFKAYIEWRKERRIANFKTRSSSFKRFFNILFSKNINRKLWCSCVGPRSNAMWMHTIVFYVCNKHAETFGIHSGPYYEEEALTLLRKAESI